MDSLAFLPGCRDHSAYIPDHGNCPATARTLQGMARVRSGQAPAWPLSSGRSAGVKSRFAFTGQLPPVLVGLRSQSRLGLEGRARTLSGPSPDLSPVRASCTFVHVVGQVVTITPGVRVLPGNGVWGCPQVGPRKAALGRASDSTGAQLPGTGSGTRWGRAKVPSAAGPSALGWSSSPLSWLDVPGWMSTLAVRLPSLRCRPPGSRRRCQNLTRFSPACCQTGSTCPRRQPQPRTHATAATSRPRATPSPERKPTTGSWPGKWRLP